MDWNNINRDRDTSGLGPIEYDQTKVPELIRKHADNVRTKTYGQEVREAQARNAELAGLIASEAKDISVNSDRLANDISSRFNDQISGSTSISEVIDARKPVGKPTHSTLNARLESDKKFRNQIYLNILDTVDDPKTITDWIPVINAAILKVREIGGGSVYFPSYTYIVRPTLDSFIKIASGVNLIGAYNAVIKVSDNNPDFFNMIHTHDGGIYGCKIEGLTFDTNGENQTSQVTIDRDKCRMLMRLEVISDFTVTNCRFYYSGINAIIATGTMYDHRNTVIQGNYFKFKNQGLLPYDNTALYIGTMGHIITNNVFESETESDGLTARTAIETHSSYGVINDNTINDFMAGVLVLGVDYRDYDYAKTITPKNISNNIIMNCLGGVLFWSSVNDVKHAVISGNTIFINHVTRKRFAEGYYGIALDHNAGGLEGANTVGDVLITGNSIKFEVSEAWLTSAEMPEISNYNFEGAFAIGSYTGINRFTSVKNVTITGNQVINSPRMPFSLSNFGSGKYEDIIIENNTAINSITQRMVPIRHKTGLLISGQANGVVYQKNTFVDSREKIYLTTEFCTPPDTSKIKRIKIRDNAFQLNQGHVGTASRLPFIVKGEGWDINVDKLRTYPNRDAMAGSTLFYNDVITLGLAVDTRNTFLVTGEGTLGTASLAGTWYIDGSVLKVPDSIDIRTIYPIQQIKINKADGSDLFTATQILGVDYINNEILISHFNTIYNGACTVSFVKPSTNSSALNATF